LRGIAQWGQTGTFAAAAAILVWSSTYTRAQVAGRDPNTVLAASRQALGGEKKLAAVKSFTVTGRTRQIRGENLVPIEFELFVELPDKYVRKDEIPAQESGVTASGFNGDALVQDPPPPAPPPPSPAPAAPGAQGGPPRNASAPRVAALKQDFTRLMLGMFASSTSVFPLTFTYVGEAEAPQGKADVLDAKGPNNFTLRFFVAKDTHLPIMVSWQGGRGPASPQRGPEQSRGTENRLYFADYRDVDGMQFPFRLRRAVGPDTIEETTFDRFRINAKIDPRRFEVRK